jgi:hypothetical protein
MTSVWILPELASAQGRWMPQHVPAEGTEPFTRFLLRRSGGRPVCFSGMLMLEHRDEAQSGQRHHVLRLYETNVGSVVIELVLEPAAGEGLAHSVVAEVDDVAAAEAFLTDYDPAAEASVCAGSVAHQAIRLEAECNRLRADFDLCRKAVFAAFSAPADEAGMMMRTN